MKLVPNDQLCLSALEISMDELLSARGFAREKGEPLASKKRFSSWFRRRQWKADVLRIASPRSGLGIRGYVQVLLEIRLVFPNGQLGLFTGTSVSDVVDRKDPYYYFPASVPILAHKRRSVFVDQVMSDTRTALAWFETLDNPSKCLNALASGDTAVGPIKEQGAAREAWDFLSALMDSK